MSNAPLTIVMREVTRCNGLYDGIVYVQITRDVAARDHAFPKAARPVLVVTPRRERALDPHAVDDGVAVVTIPDTRWQCCDIKSVALLANVLGRERAKEAGAFAVCQADSLETVSEGTSTNAWIVTSEATVVTRQDDNAILNSVTRLAALDIIRRQGYGFVERPFSVAETKLARDAFLTSTVLDLLPVVSIDGDPVGNGWPARSAENCANAS